LTETGVSWIIEKADTEMDEWVEEITTTNGSISHSILMSLIVDEIKKSHSL